MKSKTFIEMEETYGAHNYHPLDVVIERAERVYVYDVEGKKYMDFLSAYSAVNQGHCHPRIYKALVEQAKKVTLTSRAFRNDKLGIFCKKVAELSEMEMVLPMNSGAEAVETAIKAARKWGYTKKGIPENKAEIVVCNNNFHGRTTTIISFSSEKQYKEHFGPFTPGFNLVPYGDSQAIAQAITPNTAAVLIEPIQGEGGIIIPPEGYLKEVQQLCRQNNVLFILDEIQTGLGRTGKLFAYQHEAGVKPDMIIMGKALSGGFYPVSAVASSREILSVFKPGDHGSTFGGNPLAAAIGIEALDVLIDEKLAERSAELGDYLLGRLKTIDSKHIKEIRGKGLFIGIELKPEAGGARRFCEFLQEEGLLAKETHEHVIRLAPPLVITKEEIDWAFDRLKKALETL
ncbi:ornithine--oxo-acid transaminase [Caldithrix abyssi]|uniref:ornithine aminotransferase n=1 Tax=Caldithrix abyssi DSM 13497 TaxID=880073 RepID=H1XRK2_CALAY|nr:ornithine--oxo-acid transaminase [Caldithrix abyssi]APF20082.1 argD ornithine--oxo-acid transaminase [Caldithrix abyssi DSM 13497]EHO40155.1 Acetylornithine/succinyldiaminopimelateaminotran sferase [Caldithrix abyssi DSM 13497]